MKGNDIHHAGRTQAHAFAIILSLPIARDSSASNGGHGLRRFNYRHVSIMKIHTVIMFLLLIVPLVSGAGDEEPYVSIFDKYNEALKKADVQALEKYVVKVQVSVLKECLADPQCAESAIAGMKKSALSKYTVTNFVEYARGGRIVKIQNANAKIDKVNGPAVQLYYEGVEVSGYAGKGHATFGIENGVWKISMTTWGAR